MLLAPADPWAAYARTVVRISRSDADDLEVRAAPTGQIGTWPWSSSTAVHILTVWNPGKERPGMEVNRARQESLLGELRTGTASMWSAAGTDPATGDYDEGVAVRGLAETAVRDLAARYRQDAIFSWTPTQWVIVASRGRRRVSLGWSVATPAALSGATAHPST